MSFEAQFNGKCWNECGSPIWPGDRVKYMGPFGELVHVGCHYTPEKAPIICSSCFLSKPCGCDD